MSLHIKLKQYRVIHISITIVFCFIAVDGWLWYKGNHGVIDMDGAAGFGMIYLAIVGALKYALENSRQDSDHD